ncbi:MAG: DUF342 domain-containing protein [Desulfobacteraceae bacterium]|nr:DUF342 domain-containing protein [Desulfobacteraceae bacterium]
MKILIIDNDPIGSGSIADFFHKKDYHIFHSSNVARALGIVKLHPISIILCVNNQDIDCIALCRNIRNQKKERYIYFIAMTKRDDKVKKIEGLKQGVDAYTTCPVDFDKLEALVQVGIRIVDFNSPKDKHKASKQAKTILYLPESQKKIKNGFSKILSNPEIEEDTGFKKEEAIKYDILLSRMALDIRLVTKEQLAKAFLYQKRQSKSGRKLSIGDVFFEKEMISENKINTLYTKINKRLYTKFQIAVSEDRLEAHLQVNKHYSGKITPEDILKFLSEKHIQFGIVGIKEIAGFLNSDSRKINSFTVAKGKPSLPGYDASIGYHFDTDHLKAGVVNEEGRIDYRERGEIPWVKSGDLLATKKPIKKGKPGIDVFSNSIPVPETKDINLEYGDGTRPSEDNLKVYATIDGQPVLNLAGTIFVYPELIIKGDVDFNTGNINFDGNVHVNGTIMNGFVVKCVNLRAKEIVGGKIFATGGVSIQGGIINADIKAEGNVKVKFITDSNVKSFGNIIVDKEVINSKIRSSGKFKSERGKIISSFISAKMGFEAKDVGTDVSHPCRINVGLDENVKKRIQAFNHILNDKKKTLESLQKSYEKQMKGLKTIHNKMSEQKLLHQKNGRNLSAIETIIKEIESINEEKHAILKWSKNEKGIPFISVTGCILQGTKIFGIHSSTIFRETIRNVTIKEIKQAEKDFWSMMILESK